MPVTSRFLRLAVYTVLTLAGTALAGGLAMHQAERHALEESAKLSSAQLSLYANSLHTLIERYRALPAVLALDSELVAALSWPITLEVQASLNRKLERINRAAQSSALELLDSTGLAVAASNWNTSNSYVGHNYAFRPYFSQARSQGTGSFYAVGVTSGIPGYFLSCAVHDANGQFLGAMVVKLEFPDLEREWSQGNDTLLVSDARGIVFIANQPGWRYRHLLELSDSDLSEIAITRQYDKQPLGLMTTRTLRSFSDNSYLTRVNDPGEPADYLWSSLPLSAEGWTLHLLRRPVAVSEYSRNAALAAIGLWLTLVFLGLFLLQRWRLARLRQRNRDELEQLVEARTSDLRTAQDGLVQSAKLAALGQMSAVLAHEINQPLTAHRLQLATLRLLLDHGRIDDAYKALTPLEQMLTRMAALTGHLRTYARQSPCGLREVLDLASVVDQSLQLLEPRLTEENIDLSVNLIRPAWVRGDAIRLEQVLINLLCNAMDAMHNKLCKRLEIRIEADQQLWHLTVRDNGGGISEEHLAKVFAPFFTTKPVGNGLGLGLAVSYAIIHELGGRLTACNHADGALFTLTIAQES